MEKTNVKLQLERTLLTMTTSVLDSPNTPILTTSVSPNTQLQPQQQLPQLQLPRRQRQQLPQRIRLGYVENGTVVEIEGNIPLHARPIIFVELIDTKLKETVTHVKI